MEAAKYQRQVIEVVNYRKENIEEIKYRKDKITMQRQNIEVAKYRKENTNQQNVEHKITKMLDIKSKNLISKYQLVKIVVLQL